MASVVTMYLSRVLSAEESDLSPVGHSGGQQLYILIPSAKYGIYISLYNIYGVLGRLQCTPSTQTHNHAHACSNMERHEIMFICLFIAILIIIYYCCSSLRPEYCARSISLSC